MLKLPVSSLFWLFQEAETTGLPLEKQVAEGISDVKTLWKVIGKPVPGQVISLPVIFHEGCKILG